VNWLMKEEPTHYSFDDLVRDGKTSWTGVRNALAQKHLRSIQQGDRIFFYHTGDEKSVIGIARAAGAPYPDPADPEGLGRGVADALRGQGADQILAALSK